MIYSINEGKQAEEYKARKAKEAKDKKKAEDDRDIRRYSSCIGDKKKNVLKDMDRGISAGVKSIDMMMDRGVDEPYKHKDFKTVEDTVNRHMRRHPKQYNESIALYGEDADEFLESCGVELYEAHVVIEESTFDGADGEAILNENGVYLYEDHIVLEGKQAEEYKARKAKEKEDAKKAEDKRYERRYNSGGTVGLSSRKLVDNASKGGNIMDGMSKKEQKKAEKDLMTTGRTVMRYGEELNRREDLNKEPDEKMKKKYFPAYDAMHRNERRHYKESTIFKSVDLI